jgi:hypothetical protein
MHQTSWPERPGRPFSLAADAFLILGLAAIATRAAPQVATAPRFVYGPGARGYGYSPSPRAATAPQQPAGAATSRPSAGSSTSSRPRTVGPGARNWATGNRVPLHRPWMRARD